MSKTKLVTFYLIKVGKKWCTIHYDLHIEGVAIPDADNSAAAWATKSKAKANGMIVRTLSTQKAIRGSLMEGWAKTQKILYRETPKLEEEGRHVRIE